jgi:hypothetical protein
MSIELNAEIERIASHDLKERHSYFQLQHFLIGKEPTVQAKLWRCVQELKSRKDTLESIKLEIEDVNDDIELINIQLGKPIIGSTDDDVDQHQETIIKFRKLQRQRYSLELRLKSLEKRAKDTEDECSFIVASFNSLERIEKIKPQDDFEAQKEYWNEKLGQEYNLRMLFGMPLDLELIKTILALNSDAPVKMDVVSTIEAVQAKITAQSKQREYEKILLEVKKSSEYQSSKVNREKDGI